MNWENTVYAAIFVGGMAAVLSIILHDWKIVPITLAGIIAFTLSEILIGGHVAASAIAGLGTIVVLWTILYKKDMKRSKNESNIR